MKKKIIGLFLALSIVLSLGTSALAADNRYDNGSEAKSFTDSRIESVIAKKISTTNAGINVARTKTLLDFAGNEYKLVECEPIGYYIIHPESGIIVEHAINSPSPYKGQNTDLFYAGPTYYYVESDGKYAHTIIEDVLSAEDVAVAARLCDTYDSELVSQTNESVARYIEGSADSLLINESQSTRGSYWVTSYTWFQNRKTGFGYVSGGYCGYIAANLVLKYWNYRGTISLSSSYSTTNSTALTDELIRIGSTLNIGASTVAWDIKDVINKFAKQEGYSQNAHWAVGVSNITNEISNNKRPCILFGNLADAGNHAAVVYGYNDTENSGYYTFVCHYGWNNYAEVHVYGGTSVFGSNTQYRI